MKFRQNNKGSKITYRFDLFLNLLEIRFTTEKLFKQYDGLKIAIFLTLTSKTTFLTHMTDRMKEVFLCIGLSISFKCTCKCVNHTILNAL